MSPRRPRAPWSGSVDVPTRYEVFPYREEDVLQTQTGPRILLRPTLDITVDFQGSSWTTKALVDTGAPFTLFDRGAAEALGVDFLGKRALRRRHTIAGGTYTARVELVTLSLPGVQSLVWDTDVDFFESDWGMPFGCLLGHEGFLDRFVLSFNAYDGYFIVEERDSFHDRLPDDHVAVAEQQELGWKGPG